MSRWRIERVLHWPPRLARRWKQRHVVWVGPHAAWSLSAGRVRTEPAGDPGAPSRADALFEAWCAAHPDSRCDVLLSAHLVQSLLIDEAVPALSPRELRAYVRQQFAHYRGEAALAWPVALADGPLGRIACVPDGFDPARWRAAARAHGVRLRRVRPAWVDAAARAMRRAAPADGGPARAGPTRVIVCEPGVFTSLRIEAGRCVALSRRMHDGTDVATVLASVERDGAGALPTVVTGHGMLSNASGEREGVVCLPEVGEASPAPPARDRASALAVPDFLAGAPAPTPLAFALGAVGVATLAVSLVDARARDAELRASDLELRRVTGTLGAMGGARAQGATRAAEGPGVAGGAQALGATDSAEAPHETDSAGAPRATDSAEALRATGRAEAPRATGRAEAPRATGRAAQGFAAGTTAATTSTSKAADDTAEALAARGIVERLQHPWPRVLAAVEDAGAGRVRLLSLRHEAGRAPLRIEGQAVDAAALSGFVRALDHSRGLEAVALLRQQAAGGEGGEGRDGIGFEIEARAVLPVAPGGAGR